MSIRGNVTRSPRAPSDAPARPSAHGPSDARRTPACVPATIRTPVSTGEAASSPYTRSVSSDQSPARAPGSIRYGHHSAPATAEVVPDAGSRDHTRTRRPRSASTSAVVSPLTPPPTTTTSAVPPIAPTPVAVLRLVRRARRPGTGPLRADPPVR